MYKEIHDKMIVKIGVSEDTLDRIKALQTGNAFKIEEIASFDAGREAFKHERHLHEKFKDYHCQGEWFEFDEDFFFFFVISFVVHLYHECTNFHYIIIVELLARSST